MRRYRANADPRLRDLERRAAGGDPHAELALGHERNRAGLCADCATGLPTAAPAGSHVVPVAILDNDLRLCIACAAERDLARVRSRVDVFGYLSEFPEQGWPRTTGSFYAITNFMGFPLLAVTELAGISGGYTGRSLAYSAVDSDQQSWYGRASSVGGHTRARAKKQGERWLLRGWKAVKQAQERWLQQARADPTGAWLKDGREGVPGGTALNPWRKNSDASLREAHRAWGAHGEPEALARYAGERARMGLHGVVAPDPAGARALLAEWPRYKGGKNKGKFKRKLTNDQASSLIRTYYLGAGWLPKLQFIYDTEEVPSTHYVTRVRPMSQGGHPTTALPKGMPADRDPDWQPIQINALISPDFNRILAWSGARTRLLLGWDQASKGYAVSGASHWEVREYERAQGLTGPRVFQGYIDTKGLALTLLDASLRVEDPYHPNPNPPTTLYHGTTVGFDAFDLAKAQRRDSGNLGRGIYLTADLERAMMYAERNAENWGEEPVVLEVEADLGRVAEFAEFIPELEAAGFAFPPEVWDYERSERLRNWFLSRGYDSARQIGTEVVVFDPARLRVVGQVPYVPERERLIRSYEETLGQPWPGERNPRQLYHTGPAGLDPGTVLRGGTDEYGYDKAFVEGIYEDVRASFYPHRPSRIGAVFLGERPGSPMSPRPWKDESVYEVRTRHPVSRLNMDEFTYSMERVRPLGNRAPDLRDPEVQERLRGGIESDAHGYWRGPRQKGGEDYGYVLPEVIPHGPAWIKGEYRSNPPSKPQDWKVWRVRGASWNLEYVGTVKARGPKSARTAAQRRWGKGRYEVQLALRRNPDDLGLAEVVEQGKLFKTGVPVTFRYVRNTTPAPYLGSRYQQDIEPAGKFLLHQEDPGDVATRWEVGTVSLDRPLVIWFSTDPDPERFVYYSEHSWKARLAKHYGLTGAELSRALLADGYDSVVTVGRYQDPRGRRPPIFDTREIVDLRVVQ